MNIELHGAPSWADLGSPRPDISKQFYHRLFGWDSYTLTGDSFADYTVFTEKGSDRGMAGVQGLADDTQRPSWTCFFRVDDVDETVRTVRNAGGLTTLDPLDVAQLARIALFSDTQGAEFGVWQPRESGEIAPIGDRSAARWVELASRDLAESRRFYEKVFRWTPEDLPDPRFNYIRWWIGDQPAAGAVVMDDRWPAGYPAHWMPYFEADDCDVTTAEAVSLGARVHSPPTDTEPGRFSTLTDPTGARFGILTLTPYYRERF